MTVITCNAIGDIIAVVQLLRDIAMTLNDARGAAEEYRQFVHILTSLGTVLGEVYDLVKTSQNESLCRAVLEEVQRCCHDINSAHNSLTNFQALEETPTRLSPGARTGRIFTKLRWHFMRAPDAAKYAKRFSDSHQRLNTYIGLLSHQSTSQLLGEHCHYALQITRESRSLRQSAEDIKALALSALQQVSIQSRQQVVEQALSLPFFAPPRDRRVASRVQRAMDMIFDSLAPHTPAAQRERFLSLLAPFLVAGAAFVVHNNVSAQWHSTVLWPAICALVVHVLWLQSSTPIYPGFNHENAIILVDFFGDKITVPYQFCRSSEMFHSFLDLLCSDYNEDARNFVRLRLYELYLGGTSEIIPVNNWSSRILPGTCLEMGIVVVPYANSVATCPYCSCEYGNNAGHEVICAACSSQFRQTTEPWTITKWVGSFAGAAVLHGPHRDTDIRVELFQMNVPLNSSLSMAQYNQGSSALPDGAVWRRCSRVHVINLLVKSSDAPDDNQSSSKMFMNILLSDETSDPRRGHKLLRSYMDLIEDLGRLEPALRDLGDMHTSKSSCGNARQNVQGIRGYGPGLGGPMTVEEQLLGHMVSLVDASIVEASKEGIRRWEDLVNECTHDFLSLDESQQVDELLWVHGRTGDYFRRLCECLNLQ